MYLKRLDLHGFKTFARPTALEFGPGLTAIVGPNGSGKSNLVDAVRWALGEQSLRLVRGRRTEDVIFAGGPGRPPAGLAEVALTFDNSDGRLPLPHSEVQVVRRAFRSGENEYWLNRQRTRWREIALLLAEAGLRSDGYAIVGQGLVDQILSLRPEERRVLFEEAAGIRPQQLALAEAQEKLAAAQENLTRLMALLAEIQPRLDLLAQQAARARERETLLAEQASLLRAWYAHRHAQCQARLAAAAAEVQATTRALAAAQQTVGALTAERQALQRDLAAVREALDRIEAERRRLTPEMADAQRTVAVLQERAQRLAERADWLTQQQAVAEAALARLQPALAAAEQQAAEARARVAAVEAQQAQQAAQITRWQEAVRAARAEVRAGEERALALVRRLATLEGQMAELAARQTARGQQLSDLEAALAECQTQKAALSDRLADLATQVDQVERERQAQAEESSRLTAALAEARQALERLDREILEAQRRVQTLQTRLEVLAASQESSAGYYPGVRAVLEGARQGRLHGIIGPVATLLQVPPDLDLAIEVALGGHLQDIVVERWADAEQAIAFLKRQNAGRATFLPLDTLRARPGRLPALPAGVLGRASDLVTVAPDLRVVVEHLLGQVVVVTDLVVARQVLDRLGGGWQIVTVEGDLVRASGAVTGGSRPVREGGVLARLRELRRLPALLAAARQTLAERERQRAECQQAVVRLEQQRGLQQGRRQELEAALRRLRLEQDQASRQRDRLAQEEARLRQRLADLARDQAALQAAATALAEERQALLAEHERLQQALAAARARLQHLEEAGAAEHGAAADLARVLAETRAAQARAGEEVERLRAELARQQAHLARMQADLVACRQEQAGLADQLSTAQARAAALTAALERLESESAPLRQRWTALTERLQALQTAEEQANQKVRERAVAAEKARLVHARLAEDLADLERQYAQETGEAALPPPEPLAEPGTVQRRLGQVRARLAEIGQVDPALVAEYHALSERERFLRAQVADLERAADDLRTAIRRLEREMAQRFERAFRAVHEAFRRYFTDLFGGGTARLVPLDGADGQDGGVEIIAQPPGKRAQSLQLLSGGERALTAVALLCAFLEVQPPPFCLLDEVDAALDDANIERFVGIIRRLTDRTQFLVVTHNRRTMEAADLVYGVTLVDRCWSQVLALRLDDVATGGL